MKRPGNLINRAGTCQASGPARALRGEVHPAPARVEGHARELRVLVLRSRGREEARDAPRAVDHADVDLLGGDVLAHEHLAGAVGGELVDPKQRSGTRRQAVVDHPHALARDVVGVNAVVGGRGHVHRAPVAPDPLAALEGRAPADLPADGGAPRGGVRHLAPGQRPAGRHGGQLEQPGAQVGPTGGGEAVEAPVDQVLGEIHAPPARVHGSGLVLEHAHGGMAHGPAPAGGVALPHEPRLDLLARQPGAPRGPAAGAVLGGSAEDPVRVGHPAAAVEANGRGAALQRLGVRHQDEPAVVERERGRPVRRLMPAVAGAGHPLSTARHHPRGEALREPQAEVVRREARPVPRAGTELSGRGGSEEVVPERGAERHSGHPARRHPDHLSTGALHSRPGCRCSRSGT